MQKSFFNLNTTEENIPYVMFSDSSAELVSNHWHREMEIIYCVSSETEISINKAAYILGEGDIAVLAEGDSHALWPKPGNRRLVVIFSPEIFSFAGVNAITHFDLQDKIRTAARISPQWNGKCAAAAREILDALYAVNDNLFFGREIYIRSRLSDLILMLCNDVPRMDDPHVLQSASNPTRAFINLEKIVTYVEQNYQQNISLTDAAAAMSFAPAYFARFFKKHTGSTFKDYLTNYRVSQAQRLLRTGGKTISQVAAESGFASVKTFNRVFKEIIGQAPGKYRDDSGNPW